MTILKRISTKKTPFGYSLTVWVKDGDIHNDLLIGINRFFQKLETTEENKEEE